MVTLLGASDSKRTKASLAVLELEWPGESLVGVKTACSECRFLGPRLEVSVLKGLGRRCSSRGVILPRRGHWAMSGDCFSGQGRNERVWQPPQQS